MSEHNVPKYEGKVNLVSSEGDKFEVEQISAAMSELVKSCLNDEEDDGYEDADEDEDAEQIIPEIPLANVKSAVLAKIMEFCNYHVTNGQMAKIQIPLKSADMAEVVGEWDANFVGNIDQEMLFELILAANYMDIKDLIDLTLAKVASMIQGKTPEEIRKTFNIVNDFTPEEEAAIGKENEWCEDA